MNGGIKDHFLLESNAACKAVARANEKSKEWMRENQKKRIVQRIWACREVESRREGVGKRKCRLSRVVDVVVGSDPCLDVTGGVKRIS